MNNKTITNGLYTLHKSTIYKVYFTNTQTNCYFDIILYHKINNQLI